jgi:DNA polymerase-3 subunit delta'
MPHAVLLSGPAGSGKRRLALALVAALNCGAEGATACGACVSCRQTMALQHPDIQVLLPLMRKGRKDEAQIQDDLRLAAAEYIQHGFSLAQANANIPRDYIRLVQREMAFPPTQSKRKIGLIFEAECMHPAGANALLKILEEPPSYVVFVLVSSHPERILPTIRSRCQRLNLKRLSRDGLQEQLQQRGFSGEHLTVATRLGDGSMEQALATGEDGFDERRHQVERFLLAGLKGEDGVYAELLETLEVRQDGGRLEGFIGLSMSYLRDLFLLEHGCQDAVTHVDRIEILRQLEALMVPGQLERATEEMDQAFARIGQNVNAQLVLADVWRLLRRALAQ